MIINNGKYMDDWLVNNLDILAKNNHERDLDTVGIYCGREGTGKSTKAAQDAYYQDNSFNRDRIRYNLKDFCHLLLEAPPKSSVMLDEADEFAGTNWGDKQVKQIVSVMKRVRKKNLFIFFCTPEFFKCHEYLVLRCNYLITTHLWRGYRGLYRFYNASRAKSVWSSRRTKGWNAQRQNFHGRFNKWFPFSYDDYDSDKDQGIMEGVFKGSSGVGSSPPLINNITTAKND